MFLSLVQEAALHDPDIARAALQGLRRYQEAPPTPPRHERRIIASIGGTTLREVGGKGRPLVLVPSLINPPNILDLDQGSSLAEALLPSGRVLLLDWGPADDRADLGLTAHVEQRLLPLLAPLGPSLLVGYCLGGTLSLAAARVHPAVAAVVTLASPWHFSAYGADARARLAAMWRSSAPAARRLGSLPIEVLQSAFWSLDPQRVVAKFARFATLPPGSPEASRFVALEEWANGGEPVPFPAARELVEDLFGDDRTGRDRWLGGGLPGCPLLHVTAAGDRIVPSATAAAGLTIENPAGHVGMIVGRDAGRRLHAPLRSWLDALPPRG